MENRILYVGFSRPHNPLKVGSFLIRWAESVSWTSLFDSSHVFVVFPATPARPFYMVNEAAGQMVRWVSQPHFEEHAIVTALYRFEIPIELWRTVELYANLHAGAPYAFLENIGIAAVRVVKFFTGRNVRNPFGAGDGIQKCSELVMRNLIARLIDSDKLTCGFYEECGRWLPEDVDVLGVRDLREIVDYLATAGLCVKVDTDDRMRVDAAGERKAA